MHCSRYHRCSDILAGDDRRGRTVYTCCVARPTTRAPRGPLALLLGGVVVVAGMWLAGAVAAAAGWSPWLRWLAAALVWPIVPVMLLILISPRLGMRRVAATLTLLGLVVCAMWWRAGLVEAVTRHAAWMLPRASDADTTGREPAPMTPTRQPVPVVPVEKIIPVMPVEPRKPAAELPDLPVKPVEPREVPVAPGSRCFGNIVKNDRPVSGYGTTLVDLDGDEILDAVAIESADKAAIRAWKGDGAGHFTDVSRIEYDGGGLLFAVLDVDRDGKLDLATADHEKASVTLWMGLGDGTFSKRQGAPQATYRRPLAIWSADLDADGFSDLVVSHYFHVEVLRGGKGGALKAAPWLRLLKEPGAPGRLLTPEDIVAVDLTRDGLLDLVIPKGDVTSIEVWTGRGRGGFRRSASVASCFAPSHTLVGDVVEDGATDVAVGCGEGGLELFAGDGEGGLASHGKIGPADGFNAGALVDLDGDGHLDLLAPTHPREFGPDLNRGSTLTVSKGDGKGGFGEPDVLALDGFQHRVVAVVDIDRDERLDVVYECFGQHPGGHLGVAFGTGCAASDL